MTYQLIAFDMDGTLLDTQKRVLPSTTEAISDAAAAGKVVAICTGRCPKMVEVASDDFADVRYAICCNGTIVYDLAERRLLEERPLDHEVVSRVHALLAGEDVMVEAFSGRGVYFQRSFIDRVADYNMGPYQELYRATSTLVNSIDAVLDDPSISIPKFIVHFRTPEARERLIERVAGLPVELAKAEISSLEFTAQGIDKGTGLLALADLLGIPHDQTIAVGDSYNDLPMIRAAGLGVAMGNSREAVLAAANVTVADNDSGGCAEAIRRYLLGE